MFELDPRTLASYTAALGMVLAVLALGYGRMRRVYPGFGWWTASLILVSAALASIALRHVVWPVVFDYGGRKLTHDELNAYKTSPDRGERKAAPPSMSWL